MRLRYLLALLVLVGGSISGLAGAPVPAAAQTLFRPVAIVNDQAITGYDLAQRAQILVALGHSAASPDALRADALDQLVDEKLKLQAARKAGIEVTPAMVDAGVQEFARRSNLDADAFRALMNNQGVTNQAIDDMARAEVGWLQVIRARFANRVDPGAADIDSELALQGVRSGTEFRVLEIGLPLQDEGRSEAQTRALAEQLYETLSTGGNFQEAVARFSRSPSAARGGEVGWVSTGRMPAELREALDQLQVGQISRPLPVSGGISILKLVDKRSTGATPAVDEAAREAVRDQLVSQRSARLSEGLLQEMRRDALIEVR